MPMHTVAGLDDAAVRQAIDVAVSSMALGLAENHAARIEARSPVLSGDLKKSVHAEHVGYGKAVVIAISYWPFPLEFGVPSKPNYPPARHIVSTSASEVLTIALEIVQTDLVIVATKIGGAAA